MRLNKKTLTGIEQNMICSEIVNMKMFSSVFGVLKLTTNDQSRKDKKG